ncbi:hypothetical protein AVM71_13480 [Piscirickettsia salmonis]|nr:hypothetical protein AVM71_13480 [Piscirickettsia salmonis]
MHYVINKLKSQIEKQKATLLDDEESLSIESLLSSDKFQSIINNCRSFKSRFYTPFVTLILFIRQVLSPDKSCKNTVATFLASVSTEDNNNIPSSNTGPYCKARQKLPIETLESLVKLSGDSLSKSSNARWKIYNREVKLIDGTSLTMADSEENQSRYPQHDAQKAGAGFPIMRLVAIMSLTTGGIIDYAVGAYKGKGTGEHALLRQIKDSIHKDDIVMGDQYFPCFFVMGDLQSIGADGIFKAHSQRKYDFRKGRKLGSKNHLVIWKKPHKPDWMTQETYDSYPDQMTVREFKIKGEVYVTTFQDHKKYNKVALANHYKQRWHIEINFNSLKTIMSMDHLRSKTPDMVHKEIAVHFLAYNLIRTLIAEACRNTERLPIQVSFKGVIQLFNSFVSLLSFSADCNKAHAILLHAIIKNKVGNRPGRIEPRAVKKRPKAFRRLNKSRELEKAEITKRMKKNSNKK